jgi:AraC-like DNA-binding protein
MSDRFGTMPPPAFLPADPFFAEDLFDAVPDVVFFVKDAGGRYVVVNDTLVRRLGRRSKREVLGRSPRDLFPAPLGASFAAQDEAVLGRGEVIRDRLELHLRGDRRHGFCLTRKLPLRAKDGRVVGMAGISRDLPDPGRSRARALRDYPALDRALSRLFARFDEPLRRGELARLAGMSESRFARLVRRVFHLSPGQLLVKVRMEEASRRLAETGQSVAQVAQSCGYADHSAFTRQFRATAGLSPRDFRRLAGRAP